MNIGVLFPPTKSGGGMFQYASSIADGLINCSNKFQYCVVHYNTENPSCFLDTKSNEMAFIFIRHKFVPLTEKIFYFFDEKGYQTVKNLTLENYARKWEKIINEAIEVIKRRG